MQQQTQQTPATQTVYTTGGKTNAQVIAEALKKGARTQEEIQEIERKFGS
jgi:hypothetical protein